MADHDLIFNVINGVCWSFLGGVFIWLPYRSYRRCIKRLDAGARLSPEAVKDAINGITQEALVAAALSLVIGINLANIDKEYRWVEGALFFCLMAWIGSLLVSVISPRLRRRSRR